MKDIIKRVAQAYLHQHLKRAIRMPTMPRSSYVPAEYRDQPPLVPEGTDLAIWTWEEGGLFYYVIFAGKGKKPLMGPFYVRDEARRQKAIDDAISQRKYALDAKRKMMEERKNYQHGLEVGSILYSSWGYDQTNIDFYEVTQLLKSMVVIREIATKVTPGGRGSDNVMPIPGRFVGKPMRKKPSAGYRGQAYIKLNSYSGAQLWDGKPKHQTAVGWGH